MKSEWILSDEEKRLKRLKIEENKRKRRTKQFVSTSYVPSSYSSTMSNNYLNNSLQSNNSSSNSFTPPSFTNGTSPIMMPNQNNANSNHNNNQNSLNAIVYDSQIDDSNGIMMQSTPNFNSQFDKERNQTTANNFYNGYSTQTEHIQQPEIVNQLVYSHYEQYRSNSDNYEQQTNWDLSPQYSTSFNSNHGQIGADQFFTSDSPGNSSINNSATPSTFDSSAISSVSSPLNILSVISNNLQNEAANEQNEQSYSPDASVQQSTQANQTLNSETKGQLTYLRNKDLLINCLSDNQMIEEIFEQAVTAKLRPCSCKSS